MFRLKENPKLRRPSRDNHSQRPYDQGKSHPTSSGLNMQSTSNRQVGPTRSDRGNPKSQKEDRPFPIFKNSKQQLLDTLIGMQVTTLSPGRKWRPPYPHWYKPDERCPFHTGVSGHSLDTCRAFKKVVWDLLDRNVITLEPRLAPSSQTSPTPSYDEVSE